MFLPGSVAQGFAVPTGRCPAGWPRSCRATLLHLLEASFTLVLTGGAATACSLYKHSLPRPLHVLWQLFYQMHPAALCRAGAGAVLFKSRGLAVGGLPWAQRE